MKTCALCGISLSDRRRDSTWCSDRCRKKVARDLAAFGPVPAKRSTMLAAKWGLEERDLWRTPPSLVRQVEAYLGQAFALDAASAGDDAVAPTWISPEQDALRCAWSDFVPAGSAVWCNPPYSRRAGGLLAWIEAAIRARDAGLRVALLVPPSVSTRYYQRMQAEACEILLMSRRLSFICPDRGVPIQGNRGDSCIGIFKPRMSGPARSGYLEGHS